jgi:hypothetical protein
MKVAVMQPYLFPYIGYWQLINAVDKFVILDDVNYIMRGYINRNEILLNKERYRFSIPISKASQNKLIMDTKLNFSQDAREKFLKTIENAYKKSPYFNNIMPLLQEIIKYENEDLTGYIVNSIEKIMQYLSVNTKIYISSKLNKNNDLKAEDRILEICRYMNADCYINPTGGRKLYHHEKFEKQNINLYFLDTDIMQIKYYQNQKKFEESLSIIDILMFNSISKIQNFLEAYSLNEK